MSASRRDRLEARLATLHAGSLAEVKKGPAARWQRYAAVTGSAVALAANASLSSLGSTPAPASSPLAAPWHSKLAMAARSSRILTAAAALEAVRATQTAAAPAISPGGVVTLWGAENTIQPGGWVSIYGTNLASGTADWKGNFPTSLGGTTVTINGQAAYLSFVSPGQINLQAPDDTATGLVPVVVTTSAGNATSSVTLLPYSPVFDLLDSMHVATIIIRSDGSGAYGGGAYDIVGPDGNCFGYYTVSDRKSTRLNSSH